MLFQVWVASVLFVAGAEQPADESDANVAVQHDQDSFTTRITITARDGQVAWLDVLRAISRVRGFDDSALADVVPRGSFAIDKAGTRWQLAAFNVLLGPHVRMAVQPAGDGDGHADPQLVVTLDRQALLASNRRVKAWFRERVVAAGRKKRPVRPYGLSGEGLTQPDAATDGGSQRLVVLVHGFNSDSASTDGLLGGPRDAGFPWAVFDYPNDQAIAESAGLLSAELKRLKRQQPDRRVTLLTHSMGGLIARAVVEDPQLDSGNVDQLIMVAPPNQGTRLAECDFGIDLWEYALTPSRRDAASLFYGAVEDGLCEASGDLQPGSPFLKRLNARDRNANVRYSIVLGTKGPLTADERAEMHKRLETAGDRHRWVRFLGARVLSWVDDLDEAVEGLGDGVVAASRAELAGVTDVVRLRFGHLEAVSGERQGDVGRLDEVIVDRLQATATDRSTESGK